MELALHLVVKTNQSRSGISEVPASSSTMTLIQTQSTLLPSIQMEDSCYLHQTIQLWRYGISDKVTSSTLYTDMKELQQVSTFHHVETTSAPQVSIQ
jgi:hypothetical protein